MNQDGLMQTILPSQETLHLIAMKEGSMGLTVVIAACAASIIIGLCVIYGLRKNSSEHTEINRNLSALTTLLTELATTQKHLTEAVVQLSKDARSLSTEMALIKDRTPRGGA